MNMDTNTLNIPDKITFRRSEVIKISRLEGRVLDYWQEEFGVFKATVNPMGEIFYSRQALEIILKIKQWMIEENISKSKVKEMLSKTQNSIITPETSTDADVEEKILQIPEEKLKIIRKSLQDILTILEKNDKNYTIK